MFETSSRRTRQGIHRTDRALADSGDRGEPPTVFRAGIWRLARQRGRRAVRRRSPPRPAPARAESRTLLLVAVLALAPGLLHAQPPNHARGFEPRNTFELGDLEHVNLFNGNLTLTIPIGPGSLRGRTTRPHARVFRA
jgi:hypothetical protein